MKDKCTLAICMVISIALLATHAAAAGSLLIQSIPTNASVTLDGVQLQNTPVVAGPLTPGNHTLGLTLPGYLPYSGNVTVVDSVQSDVTITLTPIPPTTGAISINSVPQGAAITVNGTACGVTPATVPNLPPGVYTVNLTYPGFQPYSNISVTVTAGQVTPLFAILIPSTTYGNAAFSSVPTGAMIKIDGADTHFATDNTIFFIPAGDHTYTLSFPGYYDYSGEITIIADQTITVPTAILVPLPSPGNIYISSIPDGATIYVDGVLNGTTPKMLTLPGTLAGIPYTVNLTRPQYRKWSGVVTVYAGQTITYPQVALEPLPTYLIISDAGPGGSISPLGQVTVSEGDTAEYTITANKGYHIANFTVDGVINTTPVSSPFIYTFPDIRAAHSISAGFSLDVFTITPIASAGGSISPSTPQVMQYGTDQTFLITANTGYQITNLEIDGVPDYRPKKSPYTYTFPNVTKDHSIRAEFSVYEFTITPSAGTGGSISPDIQQVVEYNQSASFAITANPGFEIANITINGVIDTTPRKSPYTHTFRNVQENYTINAQFAVPTYTITPSTGPGGSISPSTPQKTSFGGSVPFTITANTGYKIANITIDGVIDTTPRKSPYIHTFPDVTDNHTIAAQFEIKTFTIAVTGGSNGSISPSGSVTVPYGESQVFHVNPDSGYYNDRLLLDGVELAHNITGGSYRFDNITSDHGLVATFVPPPVASFTAVPSFGTVPLTVKFNNTSPNPITAFVWVFDDGELSAEYSPTHTFNHAGNYTVYLKVKNDVLNMSSVASRNITVVTYPVAKFAGAPTAGVVPLLVQFQDLSDGQPSRWLWQFGDGGQSTRKNPYHLYEAPGKYTVTLTVANRAGVNSVAAYEYIVATEKPVASFTTRKTSGVAPFTVQFNDTSSGSPQEWSWKFGDGVFSEERNPLHEYKKPGVYSVSLTARNNAGSSTETKNAYITVVEAPVAYFTANPSEGDAPLFVQFTDRSTGNPSSFYWTFGDGASSNQKDPVHVYNKPGVFTVNHTVVTAAGPFFATDTITVTQAQKVQFEADPLRGTSPLTVQFTDTSKGSPVEWNWNFGDDGYSDEQNPVHTYHRTGAFNVTLYAQFPDGSWQNLKKPYLIEVLSAA